MSQSSETRATIRAVRRLGFGATGTEIDDALARGLPAYLDDVLTPSADPGVAATPPPRFTPPSRVSRSASVDQRKKANREVAAQREELVVWWLHRMVAVRRPVTEKLTFLWHNHFATSAQKVRDASVMIAQNEKLRAMGLGEFRPLAYAMLTDPAMLRWLDGVKNTAKAPNENLAREFMELFALGHGNGYTETDVREGARALTGWRLTATGDALPHAASHDAGIKTVLGMTGPLDAAGFCDAVLARPASSDYLASRMWQHLAADTPPPQSTLTRLVCAYGDRRDLRALVSAVITDPQFAAPATAAVLSPVEWVGGATRALAPDVDAKQLARMSSTLRDLGQVPFLPPSVGGWPGGQAWLSTDAAETRWRAALHLAADPQNTTVVDSAAADRIDAAAHLLGVGTFSDRTVSVLKRSAGNPQTLTAIALNSPEYVTA